ncbi:MAG: 2-oxo acid dehydrogenase subunit E2 [Deltaproteobacteria bacterium]|jgi:hypothetical protein|nr:2-oxo acid dehydrogenase subunit E2 [Deltaproteobacteria bacterium]MBW2531976.1 2-oxo acid dehydrogenase subunit E2 [Deltaproteobacteria bacterium]
MAIAPPGVRREAGRRFGPIAREAIMLIVAIVLGCLLVGWLLLNLPRRRSDGVPVRKIHPYRKMIPFLMPGRNESVVYYEDVADASELEDYVARASGALGTEVDVTHCLVAALAQALTEHPELNRFVVGKRLYQRRRAAVTFSMKRKRLDRRAKLAAVKIRLSGAESFAELCRLINDQVSVERSGSKTHADRELGLLTGLPRPLLSLGVRLLRWLDDHNLAPASFIEQDPFYASAFIANLGSLGMGAAFHHLYEYGTCPLFMMVGRIEERPAVVDGQVVVRRVLPIRWSYDERIDDGLTAKGGMDAVRRRLEHPSTYFGDHAATSAPGARRAAA